MRVVLSPVVGWPRLLFLRGNERVEFFFKRMSHYNWKVGADGRPTDEPNDVDDDECDALRYMVQNVLGKYSHLVVAPDPGVESGLQNASVDVHRQLVGMPGKKAPLSSTAQVVITTEQQKALNWAAVAGFVGLPTLAPEESTNAIRGTTQDASHGKKGTFSYSI